MPMPGKMKFPFVLVAPLVFIALGTYVSLQKTPLNYNALTGVTLVGLGYLMFLASLQIVFGRNP